MKKILSPFLIIWVVNCGTTVMAADELMPVIELGPYPVVGYRVANETPAGGFAQVVTHLRYEPVVDLQTRGPAESQSDVTVRAGMFEQTGFRVGALALYDPQTGHYGGELPIDPEMLTVPMVRTGVANGLRGFNSNVATIDYNWRRMQQGGVIELGAGNFGLNFQRVRYAQVWNGSNDGQTGAEVSFAHSQGDGTVANGDHEFFRLSTRVQHIGEYGQTDMFFGYVDKFYGWPGMYTGNANFKETDDYQVALGGLNHRFDYAQGSHIEIGGYYRYLRDDYELDRGRPGFFRPYEHATEVYSGGWSGNHQLNSEWRVNHTLTALSDRIVRSTELKRGVEPFHSRKYLTIGVIPEYRTEIGQDSEWAVAAGASYADDNRGSEHLSPLLRGEFIHGRGNLRETWYAEVSGHSQVPGYTALNSNPGRGAFAGNPDLEREVTQNYEIGWKISGQQWSVQAALFHRRDNDLADWTYSDLTPGVRQANPVDLQSNGIELVGMHQWKQMQIVWGYMWIDRDFDYGDALVDASYYALNYAQHRATLSLRWRLHESVELLWDQELRKQEPNRLRTSSDKGYRSSVGLVWFVPNLEGLELRGTIDNITKSDFQPFPGTPGEGRQFSLSALYRF